MDTELAKAIQILRDLKEIQEIREALASPFMTDEDSRHYDNLFLVSREMKTEFASLPTYIQKAAKELA